MYIELRKISFYNAKTSAWDTRSYNCQVDYADSKLIVRDSQSVVFELGLNAANLCKYNVKLVMKHDTFGIKYIEGNASIKVQLKFKTTEDCNLLKNCLPGSLNIKDASNGDSFTQNSASQFWNAPVRNSAPSQTFSPPMLSVPRLASQNVGQATDYGYTQHQMPPATTLSTLSVGDASINAQVDTAQHSIPVATMESTQSIEDQQVDEAMTATQQKMNEHINSITSQISTQDQLCGKEEGIDAKIDAILKDPTFPDFVKQVSDIIKQDANLEAKIAKLFEKS
ncbi:hypothetical protein MP228_008413 [Amoeboaphelidium protococcarum]|nr:hypothetical protein MP228_008413 [Amoeboaphelidium protococcarum]